PLAVGRTSGGVLASLIIGLVAGVAVSTIPFFMGNVLLHELIVFAVGIVGYLPYDTLRFRLAQLGQPGLALSMEVARGSLTALLLLLFYLWSELDLLSLSISFAFANVG